MHRSVLMLEDDSDDRLITQEILNELNLDIAIKFVGHSTELFDKLASGEKPSLILVDFNSTPENGLQVVTRLKADQSLRGIPVVILSERDSVIFRTQCYAAGASTFVTKPLRSDATRKKIETFFSYWFEVAEI